MNRRIIILESARQDVLDHFQYIGLDSPDAARRFNGCFKTTLKTLLAFPEMGRSHPFENPELQDIRFFPIKDFDKYLIFYRLTMAGVEVIRVLHAARDIYGALDE